MSIDSLNLLLLNLKSIWRNIFEAEFRRSSAKQPFYLEAILC